MGSISSALSDAANSLGVFSQAFEVLENNISNANTPGYANQEVNLQPRPSIRRADCRAASPPDP